MERLIQANQGLIWSIVRRFKDRGHELDDLYQIGAIGFIKSIKKFDTSFDVRLSTYAVPYILGEIKRYIRDDGPIKVSRSIKELGIKILEVQKEHLKMTGQDINIEDIAKKLNTSKEEIALAMDSFNPVDSIYNSEYKTDEGDINIIDKISSNVDEEALITDKISIEQLIDGLDTRDKKVIILRYFKGRTQSQVAKIMGINQVQVSRIEKKVLNSMRLKLAI